jgi:hypothetical protein
MSRTGATAVAKVASTAMLQLISDEAGATALASRRITGLALAGDPGVGVSRKWSGLFNSQGSLLGLLQLMSVASGVNLGVRTSTAPGALTVEVYQPRDLSAAVKFSVEFGNVAGLRYRIEPPTVTHALSAGQGDLHLRMRKLAVTTSTFALSWGRQVWSYVDRRDTADTVELAQAAADALADGDATVSLAATLLDTDGGRFGIDYAVGDRVTVYVRVPGQTGSVATVADVIREVALDVDDKGVETIRPAIGTFDAKAVIPTPTQKTLVAVRDSLAGLIGNK